jgi:hypothetical protein
MDTEYNTRLKELQAQIAAVEKDPLAISNKEINGLTKILQGQKDDRIIALQVLPKTTS